MRVLGYIPNSIVDGVGIRQVFFLSGCPHHCKGCHNPESWMPWAGEELSPQEVYHKAVKSPFDVTFSGGDPMLQSGSLYRVCKFLHERRNIWVYTGYTWEEILNDPCKKAVLYHIDVLVDGRFEEDKKNPELVFRGSENQRIIDVQKSLKEKKIVLWEECQ